MILNWRETPRIRRATNETLQKVTKFFTHKHSYLTVDFATGHDNQKQR